jgi:hypothetical protein
MVPALTGPVLVGAVLLALAAPGKWRRPSSTTNALRALGLPSAPALVRLLAVGEVALGAAVLLAPTGPVLAALGLAYLAFAGVVVAALRSGSPLSSCGCFGRPDTPPTRTHLVVVLGLAAAALAAAATSGSAPVLEAGVPLVLVAAVGAGLAWATLSVLPQLVAASRAPSRPDDLFRAVRA